MSKSSRLANFLIKMSRIIRDSIYLVSVMKTYILLTTHKDMNYIYRILYTNPSLLADQ